MKKNRVKRKTNTVREKEKHPLKDEKKNKGSDISGRRDNQ